MLAGYDAVSSNSWRSPIILLPSILQFCKWTCKYVAYAANSTWWSASNKLLLLNFLQLFFDSFPNLIIAFTKEWTCCGWHSSKTVKAADCSSLTNLRQGWWANEYGSLKSDHLMSLFVLPHPHHSSLFLQKRVAYFRIFFTVDLENVLSFTPLMCQSDLVSQITRS